MVSEHAESCVQSGGARVLIGLRDIVTCHGRMLYTISSGDDRTEQDAPRGRRAAAMPRRRLALCTYHHAHRLMRARTWRPVGSDVAGVYEQREDICIFLFSGMYILNIEG